LNDNNDIRLSAFPLNRMGKDNFNEFFTKSDGVKRLNLLLLGGIENK